MIAERLKDNFPNDVRSKALDYFNHGLVMNLKPAGPNRVTARVQGTRLYNVALEVKGQQVVAECSCPYYEENGCCKHLWATILKMDVAQMDMGLLGNRKLNIVTPEELRDMEEQEFGRNSEALDDDASFTRALDEITQAKDETERKKVIENVLNRYAESQLKGQPRQLKPAVWEHALRYVPPDEEIPVVRAKQDQDVVVLLKHGTSAANPELVFARRKIRKDGKWSKPRECKMDSVKIHEFPESLRDAYSILTTQDLSADYYYSDTLAFGTWQQNLLLKRLHDEGRLFIELQGSGESLQAELNETETWTFHIVLRLSPDGKAYLLWGELRRDGKAQPVSEIPIFLSSGWFAKENVLKRVDFQGAFGWLDALCRHKQIRVPAKDAPALLRKLYGHVVPPLDAPEDMVLRPVQEKMVPAMKFSPHPSQEFVEEDDEEEALVQGHPSFWYGEFCVKEVGGELVVADFDRKIAFSRDPKLEAAALQRMASLGFKRGFQGLWELKQRHVPHVATMLAREGWRVEAEGKTFKTASSFKMEVSSGVDWFDLSADIDFGGAKATLPALLKALEKQQGTVVLDDGSIGILPEEWLKKIAPLARIAEATSDGLRFSKRQAGFLDLLLAEQQNVRLDAPFKKMREELKNFDKIEAVEPPKQFVGELRTYQSEGLGWLNFLQRFGFGGILADDMGLGKTVQVLALLESRRELREKGGKTAPAPSLAVVPKSLIFNWKREAEKFAPKLRVLDHTGVERTKGVEHLADYDLILTTYGTLRNDAAEFINTRFDYVILDEAQAVKNKDTASAKAARLLKADHHLAMSGTPVENHLGELWSLMEFLNPGLLGTATVFEGLANGGRGTSHETVALLSRALKPFILRRTKAQVAKDLPEKQEETLFCELDKVQRKHYDDLRDYYRQALLKKIATEGIAKSKIVVLEALLRLRQAACHPGLIDRERIDEGCAKLDTLIPQLEEVTEEGHKALVFSQFTSFLAILRKRLDELKIPYLYLDGKTADRAALVEQFQNGSEAKLFLISLKAGGVGLNLTAAEYVFLLDPWWNPAVEAQAIDRTHRIGQTRNVFAYRLIAKDTVEEKVLELQKQKRELADAILSADGSLIRSLTREDLELLLS